MTDDPVPVGDPTRELERAYIAEFLRRRGHTFESIRKLPESAANELLKEASIYASGRLTEVESRSQYIDDVHGGAESMGSHPPPTRPRED